MKRALLIIASVSMLCTSSFADRKNDPQGPKIVNFINFIRQTEPRSEAITDEVLYQTVVEQVKLMKEYNIRATFLLQYDALIRPEYQKLLKNDVLPGTEVGGWWEITQPHVEAAGLEWRGRYPWDWHANVGFATGYTPEEREKLVDVYMEKFKEVFGYYPASVGSWFIDAHTLGYMYDKYGITASCNCKDQCGTDGYTLWGGYWNQAYYPSRLNAYMPAQTVSGQIPVPVFRMLGSDPVYQYDTGIGSQSQGVITLEPVYSGRGGGGANERWVRWFLPMMAEGECLAFNYIQAGQENSFTWDAMSHGLEIQMPIIDSLRRCGAFRVETLAESGQWFKENFSVTPATSVTALSDFRDKGLKSIWYDCRFYRANLFWDNNHFRFRDIHLFDEMMESDYLRKAGNSTQCLYTTLPLVDGYLWSSRANTAGLRLVKLLPEGLSEEVLTTSDPIVKKRRNGTLSVVCGLEGYKGRMRITLKEDKFKVKVKGLKGWALELSASTGAELPFTSIEEQGIRASVKGFDYYVETSRGKFSEGDGKCIWRLLPRGNAIAVKTKR